MESRDYFDPVYFDDQAHIHHSPTYSSDGELFTCWSPHDFNVRVWDTRTGQLVSKFLTSWVYGTALLPALTNPLATEPLLLDSDMRMQYASLMLITVIFMLKFRVKKMDIRDGTALAYYYPNIGLRTWEIADLTAEHQHSTNGHELMMQGMMDGWVLPDTGHTSPLAIRVKK